ncbi:hypothetical protein, partial [Streptomyces sp. MS191]|uniref:hypothetical protein n=1 Tax=Streptomyces sp. ms191 TaxID=1827978 RepID=UPI001C9C7962
LERIKPRTLVSLIAGAVAAYFLLSQIARTPLSTVSQADWRWVAAAVLFSALSYLAAGRAPIPASARRVRPARRSRRAGPVRRPSRRCPNIRRRAARWSR